MKDFTQHTEALELKELGFDEPCFGYYHEDMSISYTGVFGQNTNSFWLASPNRIITAPTYSQAVRWFREKYKLKCCIIPLVCEQGYSDLYESRIHQEKHSISRIGNYKTYEEAELACLRKLIEIVKENQK
jgi:hypothetical protein